MAYEVHFENLADATAPARLITVADTLDEDLELATFELTEIVFGDHIIAIPAGQSSYHAIVPFDANGTSIVVDVEAGLDFDTRELHLTLQAIDPQTGWLPEDMIGASCIPTTKRAAARGTLATSSSRRRGCRRAHRSPTWRRSSSTGTTRSTRPRC